MVSPNNSPDSPKNIAWQEGQKPISAPIIQEEDNSAPIIQEEDNYDGWRQEKVLSATEAPLEQAFQERSQLVLRLLPVGFLLAAFATWAVLGKIPNPVVGRAIILIPRSSVEIQPRQGGRVLALTVRPGDPVKKGQVLAILEFPELETELQDMRDRLADLQAQDRQITSVENNRSFLNQTAIERKRMANLRQIESLKIQMASNQSQRQAFRDHLDYLKEFQKSTAQRLSAYDKLAAEGVVAQLDVPSYLFQFNQQEVANSINRVQIELDRLEGVDEGLRAQMQALNADNEAQATEERQVDLQDTVSTISRYNAIADQQREINSLQTSINANSRVISLYNGKLLSLAVNLGEVIPAGGRIGMLEVANPKAKPKVVGLFKVGDAKRLIPGMAVEVISDLYDRERYGGIVAKVTEVDQRPVDVPELVSLVGDQELATKLLLGRDKDDRDKPMPTNASVTKVALELQTDPSTPSGYRWTGTQGPLHTITDGTTSDARAIVEERSLISYLTPAFRWITGINHRQAKPGANYGKFP